MSSVPQLYPQLEELLFPLISRMMSEEGADVLEEASTQLTTRPPKENPSTVHRFLS